MSISDRGKSATRMVRHGRPLFPVHFQKGRSENCFMKRNQNRRRAGGEKKSATNSVRGSFRFGGLSLSVGGTRGNLLLEYNTPTCNLPRGKKTHRKGPPRAEGWKVLQRRLIQAFYSPDKKEVTDRKRVGGRGIRLRRIPQPYM